jgi:fatty acid/phospholipid biosynthesis enzyme
LRGLAVIAHGNSSPAAIASAVRLAARGVEHGVVPKLGERLAQESGEQRVSIRALSESNPQER